MKYTKHILIFIATVFILFVAFNFDSILSTFTFTDSENRLTAETLIRGVNECMEKEGDL